MAITGEVKKQKISCAEPSSQITLRSSCGKVSYCLLSSLYILCLYPHWFICCNWNCGIFYNNTELLQVKPRCARQYDLRKRRIFFPINHHENCMKSAAKNKDVFLPPEDIGVLQKIKVSQLNLVYWRAAIQLPSWRCHFDCRNELQIS